jgi:hypothetical protein
LRIVWAQGLGTPSTAVDSVVCWSAALAWIVITPPIFEAWVYGSPYNERQRGNSDSNENRFSDT